MGIQWGRASLSGCCAHSLPQGTSPGALVAPRPGACPVVNPHTCRLRWLLSHLAKVTVAEIRGNKDWLQSTDRPPRLLLGGRLRHRSCLLSRCLHSAFPLGQPCLPLLSPRCRVSAVSPGEN